MAVSPLDAARRLRGAAGDVRLEALAEVHDLALVVMFGSASRGQPDARDLDVAVGARTRTGLDVIAVMCALMELVDSDCVDLLDLDRSGPVARQHALVPGEPLYEYRPGEFARQQMRASGQRLGTEWMRRLDLALMAGRPRRHGVSTPRLSRPGCRSCGGSRRPRRSQCGGAAAAGREPDAPDGVDRVLTRLVELATAINEHVVGARLQRVATSYRESFELAKECGMIEKQLRDDLLPSVGMRNILVHEYLEIDVQKVALAVPLALSCYRRYVQQVAEFVIRVD